MRSFHQHLHIIIKGAFYEYVAGERCGTTRADYWTTDILIVNSNLNPPSDNDKHHTQQNPLSVTELRNLTLS